MTTPTDTEKLALFTRDEVFEAWGCLRRYNHSIPDECLDQMRAVLLDATARESRAQPASVVGWQPIETCPHDGSQFLIWVLAETHGENDDGLFTVADNSYADIGWWRTSTDPVPYGYVDFGSQNTHDVDEPTHWMPLPAAPQPPAKDAE